MVACEHTSPLLMAQELKGTLTLGMLVPLSHSDAPGTASVALFALSSNGTTATCILAANECSLSVSTQAADELSREVVLGPFQLPQTRISFGERLVISVDAPSIELVPGNRSYWFEFSDDLDLVAHHPTKRPIGSCVYCRTNSVPLDDEHVIPLGLNGNLQILKASCKDCARVTSQLETDVLQNALRDVRAALGMRTRRPKKRPKSWPLRYRSAAGEESIDTPLAEYPTVLALPHFAPPAHISRAQYDQGIPLRPEMYLAQVAGPRFQDLPRRAGRDYVFIRKAFQPVLFARFLAKVALCQVAFELGPDALASDYVSPAILGRSADIGRWVGQLPGELKNPNTGLHAVRIIAPEDDIHVFVRLFAQFNAPEYVVVVGKRR